MSAAVPPYIASFDSASGMLLALSACLRGQDFPLLGTLPPWMAPAMQGVGATVNALPRALQEQVYIWSGRNEAILPRRLKHADVGRIARWAAGRYPARRYPAVAIGSSNGALVHLWAALGVPWLPQTFLIPVARTGVDPDVPKEDVAWAEQPAHDLLQANPDIQLHHMCDPNQDRLMIQRMSYFRFKWLRLSEAYAAFLRDHLEPGGTLFVVDCRLKWPTTRLGERHLFQFGALGGLTPEEYQQGSPRVADFLARYGSAQRRWDPPAPDGERPEAEWGFAPELLDDLERLSRERGFRLRRVVFDGPEDMSPLVADFYLAWNRRRGVPGRRLIVDSFILMEPFWTLRTGSAPFWMVFNTEASGKNLSAYLDTQRLEEIYMMLFSNGADGAGLVPIDAWRRQLQRATLRGEFLGVDEAEYPRDFAVFARYHDALKTQIRSRYPMPAPLPLATLDAFLAEHGGRYRVQWLDA